MKQEVLANLDDEFQIAGNDDDEILPVPAGSAVETATPKRRSTRSSSPAEQSEQGETEAVDAPLRPRKRAARLLPFDENTMLGNAVVRDWQNNYIARMDEARRSKRRKLVHIRSKSKVENWCLNSGIGGVGTNTGRGNLRSLLSISFAGSALFEALTGDKILAVSRKRVHEESDVENPERNVQRLRQTDDGHLGQAEALLEPGDDGLVGPEDEVCKCEYPFLLLCLRCLRRRSK